ncbi:hypothetical protein T440DRAFT_212839 [Plenodomus tracheiphilus IPT5]|uniref:Uncharacterized protein n=1 Tax=Plenodomus tracheiphilus IPT5 TaxID=1408161 RepID=A0A6A7AYU5_9PLEO|nr:hypothetical protein T440DRAFT_212839 [Plenodomus tracheiphilus IPT5]
MEIEAPTFNSLNKPQKRALILRDKLRWYDPQHLDSFIEGLANPEPPHYKKINGITKPDLILVKLKDSASHFDLGNVIFPDEDKGILHAYLALEDGKVEMHTEEALSQSDQNINHIAIHGFIASTMVPMFKDKIGLIMARINKFNDVRRAAYNSPTAVPVHIGSGETLSRLQAPKRKPDDGPSPSALKHWKREPNTPVAPHMTNKRLVAGLSSIPVSLKTATFAAIPEQIKIDLFNNIASTAFPNFDNLMIASWNVVSVYSACGSDFPEMHKAVVELKDVLQDFDAAFGAKVSGTPVQYRTDWAGEARSGHIAARAWTSAANLNESRGETGESSRAAAPVLSQQDKDTDMTDQNEGGHLSDAEKDLSAHNILPQDEGSYSDSEFGEDDIPARRPTYPRVRQRHERHKPQIVELSPTRFPQRAHTPKRSIPSHTPSAALSARPTPALTSVQIPISRSAEDSEQSAELIRRRSEWASSQNKIDKTAAKKTQASETKSTALLLHNRSASINAFDTAPRAANPTPNPVASSLLLSRTSPAPTTTSPAPVVSASAASSPSPAVSKRKASGSPAPGVPKKKQQISTLTNPQLQEKFRITRTQILRSWNCLDPDVVPRSYLELHDTLKDELVRRKQVEVSKDGPATRKESSSQQVAGRDGAFDREGKRDEGQDQDRGKELAPANLQQHIQDRTEHRNAEHVEDSVQTERSREVCIHDRTPERTPQRIPSSTTTATLVVPEARPIVKGMFGAYLGKSMLGPKKLGGIAPVAPMFGTSPQKERGGSGDGSGSGSGGGDAGADANADASGEKKGQ